MDTPLARWRWTHSELVEFSCEKEPVRYSSHLTRGFVFFRRLCPTHASAHNNLGTVVTSAFEAEKHFRKAINLNLHHAAAHYNLALLYR